MQHHKTHLVVFKGSPDGRPVGAFIDIILFWSWVDQGVKELLRIPKYKSFLFFYAYRQAKYTYSSLCNQLRWYTGSIKVLYKSGYVRDMYGIFTGYVRDTGFQDLCLVLKKLYTFPIITECALQLLLIVLMELYSGCNSTDLPLQ